MAKNYQEKCDESQKINPTNPYSASKAAAEVIINSHKYSYKKRNYYSKRQ